MGTDSNIAAIQDLYGCFGRGDLPGLLEHVADEVDWSYRPDAPGTEHVPMLQNLRSKAEVGEVYFGAIASMMDVHAFVPRYFFAEGDDVLVLLHIEYTVIPTGREVSIDEVHHFTFGPDGTIVRYRPILDTATLIAAFTP